MAGKNKPFRPLLVSYNKEEHNRVEKLIEEKLMLLDEASVWINNVFERDGEKVYETRKNLCHSFHKRIFDTFG